MSGTDSNAGLPASDVLGPREELAKVLIECAKVAKVGAVSLATASLATVSTIEHEPACLHKQYHQSLSRPSAGQRA